MTHKPVVNFALLEHTLLMKDSVKIVRWEHSPTPPEPLFVLFVVVVNNITLQQMNVKIVQRERSHELERFATFVQSMNTQV